MLTLEDYWMGRDVKYKADLTYGIRANAETLLDRVNLLLVQAESDGIAMHIVVSGWRPPSVNEATSNAGKQSNHLTGHGVDLKDNQHRILAHWCIKNLDLLEIAGLWMEHPGWTGGPGHSNWVHLQDVPPKSGKRVYIPSQKPPFDPEFVV